MAASREPARALCRIVKEWSIRNEKDAGQLNVETLGVASVLKLTEATAKEIGYVSAGGRKCECFLAASAQVLSREMVQVRSRRRRSNTKIVAEFLGQNTERVIVNDVIRSHGDVWEKKGILYIAITKPPRRYWFWKTSIETSRPLEVFYDREDQKQSLSKELSVGSVECYVLRERSQHDFDFRPYDLMRMPRDQNADDNYVLKAGESNMIATKDDFPGDERAVGAVILKQEQFIGVLYFRDKRLFPLPLGGASEEDYEMSDQLQNEQDMVKDSEHTLSDDTKKSGHVSEEGAADTMYNQSTHKEKVLPQTYGGVPAMNEADVESSEGQPNDSAQEEQQAQSNIAGLPQNDPDVPLLPPADNQPETLTSASNGPTKEVLRVELPPKKVQPSEVDQHKMQHQSSFPTQATETPQKDRRLSFPEAPKRFSTDSLVKDSVLGCLKMLHPLSKCLDVEYSYGTTLCWKDLAEELGIQAKIYESFKYSSVESPTEQLLDYVTSCTQPDLTIGKFKKYLISLDRYDVVDCLQKHIRDQVINEQTPVAALYDSKPDIIGEICPLLDRKPRGVKNWTDMATLLQVPRSDYKHFESTTQGNPTEKLIEYLCIHYPRLTVGEFKERIQKLGRTDVVTALNSPKKGVPVLDSSRLKELMDNLDVFETVCHLLDQPVKMPKKNWLHLGSSFSIGKDILSTLAPVDPETARGPTEALFEFLKTQQPDLSLSRLVIGLHKINRKDALDILEEWLPEGSVDELLQRCYP